VGWGVGYRGKMVLKTLTINNHSLPPGVNVIKPFIFVNDSATN
jgi:hypothetical protein